MREEDFNSKSPGRLLRTPEGALAFVPHPLPPKLEPNFKMMGAVDKASGALSELSGVARNFPAKPFLLVRSFSRKEAEASSRIEGTETELGELFVHEVDPTHRPEGADVRQEVLNYTAALEAGLERVNNIPVSSRFVKELHGKLMEGVRGQKKDPGNFRRIQNRIGGTSTQNARYVPPPVPEMEACMSDWENFIHEKSEIPPLMRLALIHYQFEAIHPFLDGNGRVGRLLIPILLSEWKLLSQPLLYLSSYFERNRDDYVDLMLEISQKGDWESWILFFLAAIEIQAKDASWRSKKMLDKKEEYQSRADVGKNANTLRLVDDLIGCPVFNSSQAKEQLKVSLATTLSTINRLVEAKILREITGKERNRIWMADEIFDILLAENETNKGPG